MVREGRGNAYIPSQIIFYKESNCAFAQDFWEKIDELERFAYANDVPAIIHKLKEMVPEYTPSEYVRQRWLSP